jgi:hypothetical protein
MGQQRSGPVIILGAGASKAAFFSSGARHTPPLDAEFLKVAGGLSLFKSRPTQDVWRTHYSSWVSLKTYLNRAGLSFKEVEDWRLEQLSTFLEARATLRGLQLNQGRPINFRKALDNLKGVVSSVLLHRGGDDVCELHRDLFHSVAPSAVVTFNYDLIADRTLADLGKLKWDAAAYRGAKDMRVRSAGGHTTRLARVPRFSGRAHVPLFKMHGSMNWEREPADNKIHRLSGLVPGLTGADTRFLPRLPFIIPPVAAKTEIPQCLSLIWRQALKALYNADHWIFWGYSFPTTDTISQVLFRTALSNNKSYKRVVVINPDQTVASRVRNICRKVKVSSTPSMERYLWELDAGGLNMRRGGSNE